jgi:predicted RNA-binding protein with PUA-like domain
MGDGEHWTLNMYRSPDRRGPAAGGTKRRSLFASAKNSATLSRVKNFWLVKQEPSSYSWADFTKEGKTSWTGVRNYTARNNLRKMRRSDEVLFYHSGEEKAVVGVAKVARAAYADPTALEGDWSAVDLVPAKPLPRPVTLPEIRHAPRLRNIQLLRQSRLSVMPLTKPEFEAILKMGR